MAGDWIKMRVDLHEDPAVVAIACTVELDEFAVVGRLHRFWSWADQQTTDGNASSVTKTWLDRYVCATGFADAMVKVGWLNVTDQGLSIPHFEHHNGETGKRRALTAKRQATFRNASSNAKRNAPSVTRALPREEKRREEKEEKADHRYTFQRTDQNDEFDQVNLIASQLLNRLNYEGPDGGLVWRIAWLVHNGDISEHAARDAAESVAHASQPIANPVGYFRATIEETIGGRFGNGPTLLSRMLAQSPAPPRRSAP